MKSGKLNFPDFFYFESFGKVSITTGIIGSFLPESIE